MPTHYEILKVPMTGSPEEIRRAYQRAAMRWHPDRHVTRTDEATVRFKKIAEAYRVLSDEYLRHRYDVALRIRQERRAGREGLRAKAAEQTRIDPDKGKLSIVSAIAYRVLFRIDMGVDAVLRVLRRRLESLPHGRRMSRAVRRYVYVTSRATLLLTALVVVLAVMLAAVPLREMRQKARAAQPLSVPAQVASSGTSDGGAIIKQLFPRYDASTQTTDIDLGTFARTTLNEAFRRFAGEPVQARFDGREDLGSDYRMYYFAVALPPARITDCPECSALYMRFMSRAKDGRETVVTPPELVVEFDRDRTRQSAR